ncbi:hypothetical protein SCLCIDRAFT_916922 [Scleroderma citrinum Foug A]|uniref:Uncharacterized protein n=1 Tax=Scleroderma citrinum Foug A TaxID=1036808 RepID=A0A0C2ZH45_9AGAM|nr:hypothetical protein SCLCIDRAFT_916922 [Scleroderma citrinum Foug A]
MWLNATHSVTPTEYRERLLASTQKISTTKRLPAKSLFYRLHSQQSQRQMVSPLCAHANDPTNWVARMV